MMVLFSSCFLQKQLPFSSFKVKCRQGGRWGPELWPHHLPPPYIVGYNDFNNLVLPGRWWLQNLILRHICKKSFYVFFSRFVRDCIQSLSKVLIWSKTFFCPKSNLGIKKHRIWCWFQVRWKSCTKINAKNYQQKVTEKWMFFLSLLCAKPPITFCVNFFRTIFNGFKLGLAFCVLWYPYRIFIKEKFRSTFC